MFMSTKEAAEELGMSDRQARRAAEAGHIQAEQIAGRLALYEKQVFAYKRVRSRGRNWSQETRLAALDLLSSGNTERLNGTPKSRLKARLRSMSAGALAKQLLEGAVTLYSETTHVIESDVSLAAELGLVGSLTKVWVMQGGAREASRRRLVRDANGSVVAVEGEAAHARVLEAFALYSYGDTREQAAVEEWLERRRGELL